MNSANDKEPILIACLGNRFDAVCTDVIRRISCATVSQRYRFAHWSWLRQERSAARVAWVVDRTLGHVEMEIPLKMGIPLLVPESNHVLRDLCVRWACGLYYATPTDTEACLHLLGQDSPVRAELSRNAKLYWLAGDG